MFTRVAALDIVPLLARLALALILVPSGWTLLTAERTFAGDHLDWLERLGIVSGGTAKPAAWRLEPPESTEAAATPPEAPFPAIESPREERAAAESAKLAGEAAAAAAREPLSGEAEGVAARRLHELSVLFAAAGWPSPVLLAWSSALFSLLGGSALLLGLVTRLWALLAAGLFGSLFWIESAPIVAEHWMFGLDAAQTALVASQGSLFVLSLAVLLTGGGCVSLDRAIFRSAEPADAPAAA
jgi:uncharacterized membrane protein YphA (DoxX/SURF4 family)